jgi:hypothetical protein
MKRLNMTTSEIVNYADRGYLQEGQVVFSIITKKKYRVSPNNNMPTSFEDLQHFASRSMYQLKESSK